MTPSRPAWWTTAASVWCIATTATLTAQPPPPSPVPSPSALGGTTTASGTEPRTEEELLEASDTLFAAPDDAGARADNLEMMSVAARENPSYPILWRAARAAWAVGDRLEEKRDSALLLDLGTQALGWAEEAVRLRPDGLDGRFYRALSVSTYARGRGMFRCLLEGLGGKFESDMEFVIGKDPSWQAGAAYQALGRYWYVAPWPKRNLARSEELLRKAIDVAPAMIRTHLFLADTLAARGRKDEAEKEYRFVLDHQGLPADANAAEFVRGAARSGLLKLGRG